MLVAMASGCASSPGLDMNKVAQLYYAQQSTRVYKAYEITGVDKIEGHNMTFTVNTHMEPLNILPRDPTWMESVMPTLGSVATFGLGAMAAQTAFKEIGKTPKTVEQPAPLVVKPEVVMVPAP